MTRAQRAVTVAVVVVALCLAAGLVALAQDARGWREAMADDDVRFQMAPARARWEADQRAPFGLARRALGVGDDVALRRALRVFQVSRGRATSFEQDEARTAMRARAQIALSELLGRDGDPRRRSLAENLLGLLSFEEAAADPRASGDLLRAAAGRFRRSIALDPAGEEAKYNLELTLRLLQPSSRRSRERMGIFGVGEGIGAGSSRAGTGY
ncbi:MAG: hypothetical protein ABR583_05265 [Gaiellaceae bacterium]